MARWTASAKWAEGLALDGQRAMPLALRLSEGLGLGAECGYRTSKYSSDAIDDNLGNHRDKQPTQEFYSSPYERATIPRLR